MSIYFFLYNKTIFHSDTLTIITFDTDTTNFRSMATISISFHICDMSTNASHCQVDVLMNFIINISFEIGMNKMSNNTINTYICSEEWK